MWHRRTALVSVLVVLATIVSLPAPVRAETFLEIYGGGAFPADTDTTVSGPGFSIVGESPYKDSFVVGGRAGHYFEGVPWLGLALDVSYFKADIDVPDGAKNDVVPISMLLMMRAPLLRTPSFPYGRLQPYLGIGPSLVYSRSESGSARDTYRRAVRGVPLLVC
jgi:hypothetical protein